MTNGLALVTGANGLVGAATCEALRAAGWTVLPVVGRRSAPVSESELPLDLAAADLAAAVPERPDIIVHLAAAVPHARDYPDDEGSAAVTRRIDRTVHEAARAWRVPVVYASTCGVYRRTDPNTKTESAEAFGSSPYFQAKLQGEALMLTLPECCIIRLSAVVGPRLRRSVVLAKFIERARQGLALEIWGSGKREQDFIASSDIGAFVATAVSRRLAGIFNVAAGVPTTMHSLAALVVDVVGSGTVRFADKADPLERETARYSIAAARAVGWQPRAPLRSAIAGIVSASFID